MKSYGKVYATEIPEEVVFSDLYVYVNSDIKEATDEEKINNGFPTDVTLYSFIKKEYGRDEYLSLFVKKEEIFDKSGSVQIGEKANAFDGGVAIGYNSYAEKGAAIGYEACSATTTAFGEPTGGDGGAVGYEATTVSGGAVGSEANSEMGGAIGKGAYAFSGGAVGEDTKAGSGGAVGKNAYVGTKSEGNTVYGDGTGFAGGKSAVSDTGGSVGEESFSTDGFAGGYKAKALADGAVQLGEGENKNADTLQFRDYQVVDENGKIPLDRLDMDSIVSQVLAKMNS